MATTVTAPATSGLLEGREATRAAVGRLGAVGRVVGAFGQDPQVDVVVAVGRPTATQVGEAGLGLGVQAPTPVLGKVEDTALVTGRRLGQAGRVVVCAGVGVQTAGRATGARRTSPTFMTAWAKPRATVPPVTVLFLGRTTSILHAGDASGALFPRPSGRAAPAPAPVGAPAMAVAVGLAASKAASGLLPTTPSPNVPLAVAYCQRVFRRGTKGNALCPATTKKT